MGKITVEVKINTFGTMTHPILHEYRLKQHAPSLTAVSD